jgi:hypothetical protein
LEENEVFNSFKTVICRKYYFQKPTQFSWGHNVVDAPDSDTFGFFGDTSVLST